MICVTVGGHAEVCTHTHTHTHTHTSWMSVSWDSRVCLGHFLQSSPPAGRSESDWAAQLWWSWRTRLIQWAEHSSTAQADGIERKVCLTQSEVGCFSYSHPTNAGFTHTLHDSDRCSSHTACLSGVSSSCCCVHTTDWSATGSYTLHNSSIGRSTNNPVWSKTVSQLNTREIGYGK